MSVTLRKRKNSDGTTSQILDIYYNHKRSYEFLKDLKLVKPSNLVDREENRQREKLAKEIARKREQELEAGNYDIVPDFKRKVDFVKYFEAFISRYQKKDKRVISGCLYQFKKFMVKLNYTSIDGRNLSEQFIRDFKDYLELNLNGETPTNYFKKFKLILRTAHREGILNKNHSSEISIKRKEGIKKDILTIEEIQKLAKVTIGNEEVKRAFLFSCYTGLRFCDIINLKWNNIHGGILKFNQLKTNISVTLNLHLNAKQLLGFQNEHSDFIFSLPSHNACLKNLKSLCKKAEVKKKITWHCARHSFATNLIFYGGDVSSVMSLLGHNSLTYTQRYVRLSKELKDTAIQNLPEILI